MKVISVIFHSHPYRSVCIGTGLMMPFNNVIGTSVGTDVSRPLRDLNQDKDVIIGASGKLLGNAKICLLAYKAG